MKNKIYTNYYRDDVLIFDSTTMDASLIQLSRLEREKYEKKEKITKTTYDRNISWDLSSWILPRAINVISVESADTEKIILRNKSVGLKCKKDIYKSKAEEWNGIEPYKPNNDKVMTIDLIKKEIKINSGKNGKKEVSLSLISEGNYKCISDFIKKNFLRYRKSIVIADCRSENFYDKIKNLANKELKFKYVLDMKDMNIHFKNVSDLNKLKYGLSMDKLITESNLHSKLDTQNFSNQMAGIIFLFCNPGVESVLNSPYKQSLYMDIFYYNKTFQNAKLHEALNIDKTTLKMMKNISSQISSNISLITSAKCNEEKINEIIGLVLMNNKNCIGNAIDVLKGYNNLEYILEAYFNNNFYYDYFSYLKKYYNSSYNRYGYSNAKLDEEQGQKQFESAVEGIGHEILNMIRETNALICNAPQYLNNVKNFAEYITKLNKKQGFQKISSGIRLLKDYVAMQNYMDAKFEKYPYSIALVHDIAANNLSFYKSGNLFKEHCAGFIDAVEEYSNLNYVDKQNGFVVVSPNNVQEMFVEGCNLCHCVASYIPLVASKANKILFIRKFDERETPYFTVNVVKNEIIEVKGMNQVDPVDTKLIEFITKWAEIKELKINCL